MTQSLHDVSDPRNATILINVNGELKPRAEAVVSVFDSGFMLGDGVWEGLRVHRGRIAFLDRHLNRLFEGAGALAMELGISREALAKRLLDTLDANRMEEGVHIRLMVTRGVRSTPYQDPRVVVGVGDVLTVHSSPDQVTVMMNVDFRDSILAGEVERIVCRIEEEARERWPQVKRLFVRPMQGAAARRKH
jgi:branched-chain amino acid aminotransferase